MDHDGAIDDLLSQLLLLTIENVELLGINVTPADCFLGPGMESTYKLLQLIARENIPLGRGDYHGINAFPNEWRARQEVVNALPMLINLPKAPDPYGYPNAVDLMTEVLSNSKDKVSILITGPCSNLVFALERSPELKNKISEIVWMAGAFRVQGNVQNYQHDGSAEWNVYWDPLSADKLFAMELPLILVPLDITNHVPVQREFLSRLARQAEHQLSNLAGQFWALTTDTIPSYHYCYYMWDILATSYLGIPEQFNVETIKAKVSTKPPNAGQTVLDVDGFEVKICTDINKEYFYDYLLTQFSK